MRGFSRFLLFLSLTAISCGQEAVPVDGEGWQAGWCHPDGVQDSVGYLLPRPLFVRVGGGVDAIDAGVTQVSWCVNGADLEDGPGLAAVEAATGIERVACADAGLEVFFHPVESWDDALLECDVELPERDEAYMLHMLATPDGRDTVDVVAPTPAGRRMALHTIAQIVRRMSECHSCLVGELFVADAPAAVGRGVVETFYGAPYTESERSALLPYLAGLKFNQYIYAAKMDIWVNWIGPYWTDDFTVMDAGYVAFLERLAADISANGMTPGIQVRPLDQITFSSSEDVVKFVEKVRFFEGLGFRIFSLSFDDTDKLLHQADLDVFESYDDAVTAFSAAALAAVREALPDVHLGWVPTDYFTSHPDAATSLPMAGDRIPAAVSIGWTGREVIPVTITAADADEVAAMIDRKPLLGDNYPVWEPTAARYFLGPLFGRAADLVDHLDGIMFNPNPAPFPSLPALATCADYAWNPQAYDPDRSMVTMSRVLGGHGPAGDALLVMAEHNRSHIFHGSMAPSLKELLDRLLADFQDGGGFEYTEAMQVFQAFADVPGGWESPGPDAPLKDALQSYAVQTGRLGLIGMKALEMLNTIAPGGQAAAADLEYFDRALAEIRAIPVEPTGDVMIDFLNEVSAILHPMIPE